ncbi:hypothetical protein [Gimesia maris]|uniref:hypothetical protein n=1 Tax=Gimesia maris TaxID=122 RepID=UPI00241E85A4|nr:hypothetical protein [Gimesia maris]|tara:strand:+ start:17592 stop:18041 length:450 start_codon:yes stop_codon:yes gene_type:complete
MDWFLFLKYFLIAVCSTLAVWFTIKIGFRGSTEIEEGAPESEVLPGDDSQKDSLRCLYWNFTAVLIVVPTLLLVLGITMQTAAWYHPVTLTLAGALLLIWGMTFWTGMLAFPEPVQEPGFANFSANQKSQIADEPSRTWPSESEGMSDD